MTKSSTGTLTASKEGERPDTAPGLARQRMSVLGLGAEAAIRDFRIVARLAGTELSDGAITIEHLPAPHAPPTLPKGKMAVYVFSKGPEVLKVGRVGPRSQARYTTQHYHPGSAMSTLAASVLADREHFGLAQVDEGTVGQWIKSCCDRVNFLVDVDEAVGIPVLTLLEAFLQCRLRPRYEGGSGRAVVFAVEQLDGRQRAVGSWYIRESGHILERLGPDAHVPPSWRLMTSVGQGDPEGTQPMGPNFVGVGARRPAAPETQSHPLRLFSREDRKAQVSLALALKARGRPDAEIGRILGVADQTVARWTHLDISAECQDVEPVLLPQADLDAIAQRLKDEARREVRGQVEFEVRTVLAQPRLDHCAPPQLPCSFTRMGLPTHQARNL